MTQPPIRHVFVLMLENHSFDHIFAMSGIEGITKAGPDASNGYQGQTYTLSKAAPVFMSTDPGHEFNDVLEQLTGRERAQAYLQTVQQRRKDHVPVGTLPYPEIDGSGFVSNYAVSTSEGTGRPTWEHYGDVMACFDTPTRLPVIHALAQEFAICDHWFSALPGPTWPNRFFVHGATSMGDASSPGMPQELKWELLDGFAYDQGSIFQSLTAHGKTWRLYNDRHNRFSDDASPWWQFGWIPQVAALKGIHLWDVHALDRFEADLNSSDGYPYDYTFIEPNYGESVMNSYKGGSSQHPEDDPVGGEGLIKRVYESIRNSPLWENCLLVITYDEHGGCYDSVAPRPAARPDRHVSDEGFDFSLYGVRVPAVVVSPLIKKGTVSRQVYDHTSILKTLQTLHGLPPLTGRDAAARDLLDLLALDQPRQDCPKVLPMIPLNAFVPAGSVPTATKAAQPLPATGNLIGFLRILLKAELALAAEDAAARDAALARFAQVQTLGQAQAWFESLIPKLDAAAAAAA